MRMKTIVRTIRRAAVIVIGGALTSVCVQAQTAGSVASRGNVAPRGCVYVKMWKPPANLTMPKEFNRIPADNGSSEKLLFGGLSGANRIFRASQSNEALGVASDRPPTISHVAVWLYDRTLPELLCGTQDAF
jgi:hypothetical protein